MANGGVIAHAGSQAFPPLAQPYLNTHPCSSQYHLQAVALAAKHHSVRGMHHAGRIDGGNEGLMKGNEDLLRATGRVQG